MENDQEIGDFLNSDNIGETPFQDSPRRLAPSYNYLSFSD